MKAHIGKSRSMVVVSLAAHRASRAAAPRQTAETGRRLLALRLPTPREIAHRRRMLDHLAATRALGG